MEDVSGVDRQERRGSPKEHGEEIERDRAEEDWAPAHVGDALDDPLEGGALTRLSLPLPDPQIPHRDYRKTIKAKAQAVIHRRTELVEDAANGWSADRSDAVAGGIPGDRLRQFLEAHQEGQKRLNCGLREAERHPQKRDHAVKGP